MLSSVPDDLSPLLFERWLEGELERVLGGLRVDPRVRRPVALPHRRGRRARRIGWRATALGVLGLASVAGGVAAAAQAGWLGARPPATPRRSRSASLTRSPAAQGAPQLTPALATRVALPARTPRALAVPRRKQHPACGHGAACGVVTRPSPHRPASGGRGRNGHALGVRPDRAYPAGHRPGPTGPVGMAATGSPPSRGASPATGSPPSWGASPATGSPPSWGASPATPRAPRPGRPSGPRGERSPGGSRGRRTPPASGARGRAFQQPSARPRLATGLTRGRQSVPTGPRPVPAAAASPAVHPVPSPSPSPTSALSPTPAPLPSAPGRAAGGHRPRP